MKAMKPRVAFMVPNTLTGEGNLAVDITFESMDDFSPAAVARKVDALNKLLEARTQLSNLLTYMDGKSGAEELIAKVLNDPALLQTLAAAPKPGRQRPSGCGGISHVRNRNRTAGRRQPAPTAGGRASSQSLLNTRVQAEDRRRARARSKRRCSTLAEQALSQTALISDDALARSGDHRGDRPAS